MQCLICHSPAKELIVFQKEHNSQTGYLAGIEDKIIYDSHIIEQFAFAATKLGAKLEDNGIVDLCSGCKSNVLSIMAGKELLHI